MESPVIVLQCARAATPARDLKVRHDPVDDYWRAFHAHDAREIDTETYLMALRAMDDWVPATPRDFVRKFCTMFGDGGVLTDRRLAQLVAQAHRLLAEGD